MESFVFSGCSALAEVSLPDSLETIGEYALNIYTLRSVVIPENVTSIAHYGLAATNLKKIRFLGDCPEIHESAFTYVTANAYYPDGNNTWDTGKLKHYGGNLTWKVQCGDGHNYVDHSCSECGLIGGTGAYNFVWEIIHHVYGDRYDEEYQG